MNNQPRLIDADKLLEWMEKSPDAEGFWQEGNMYMGNTAFDNLTDAINEGLFDPIPLPTIKPGDKVMYKRSSSYGVGEVKGIDAFVKFENMDFTTRVSLDDLEVSHD